MDDELLGKIAELGEGDDIKRARSQLREKVGEELEEKIHRVVVKQAMTEGTDQKSQGGQHRKKRVEGKKGGDSSNTIASSMQLLYQSCRGRVLLICEKIANHTDQNVPLCAESKPIILPDHETWDFHLGDRVKIKLPPSEFKAVQEKVIGWTPSLAAFHGHVGFIKRMRSPFENVIEVYFPKMYDASPLYAGVLEKVETDRSSSEYEGELVGEWKVGDFVTTQSERRLIEILQVGLPSVPTECIGKRGQILGVTRKCILVTFDSIVCHQINPALLIPSTDETPIATKPTENPKGFQIGGKMKIIKNMKKLIQNQKGHGGWVTKMSSLRGQEVTIMSFIGDGDAMVHKKHDREWMICADSILPKDRKEKQEEDLPFLPGDAVKIKIPHDIREILEGAGIPLVFIEYLRLVGTVGDIKEDFTPCVRFSNWRHAKLPSTLLCQPSIAQKGKFLEAKRKLENLEPGSTIFLDVGPPNLVTAILKEAKKDKSLIKALTNCSKLVSFLDNDSAVIEYDDGTRYRVQKQFLSVPKRFFVEESSSGIDFEIYRQIQESVEECIQNAHDVKESSDLSPKVETINILHGNPPRVDITISPAIATHEDVTEWLRENRKWAVEILCVGQLLVRGNFGKVKINLLYDEDERKVHKDSDAISEDVEKISEKGSHGLGAEPERNEEPTAEELGQQETRYLRLYDPRLERDVFFPYVVHGDQRTPIVEGQQQQEPDAGPGVVNQIFNIVRSNVNTIINRS